jgi:hypothetical protein
MQLSQVIPWGRSLQEYRDMFALTEEDLDKSILGCGDGPASFNTELNKAGGNIISVDPVYQFNAQQIQQRIQQAYPLVMKQIAKETDKYLWTTITDVAALGRQRMAAMELFLDDYQTCKQEERYINGALPILPFAEKQFQLALCSHYLFLYSEQKNLDHHIESILELCRVADEVRVYPLLTLEGTTSPHLSAVLKTLAEQEFMTSLKPVPYQFQKGATEMLVIQHSSAA